VKHITSKDWGYTKDPDKHYLKLSKAYRKAEERWINTQSRHLEDVQSAVNEESKKRELEIFRELQYAWHELRLWSDTVGGIYSKRADYLLGKNLQFKR
jgi:hypothetical protein